MLRDLASVADSIREPNCRPSRTMTDESCRLCSGPGPLRDSHVIPECVYRPVYDSKHRAAALDLRRAFIPYVQKGLRERLLCGTCEQKFGRWEHAFCRFWKPASLFGLPITQPHFCVSGFPYDAFKLFHLSVLWRACVATSEAFQLVKLGPHETHLRDILLKGQAPDDFVYPVSASILRDPASGGPLEACVMASAAGRVNGVKTYVIIFAGCAWHYAASNSTNPFPEAQVLSRAGHFYLPVVDATSFPPLAKFMKTHAHLETESSTRGRRVVS